MRAFTGNCEVMFTRVSSYSGTISGGVKIFTGLDEAMRGRDIILVEDIIDSGKTVTFLQKELELLQPASVCTVALLQKNIPGEHIVQADIFGFTIPDNFVVGYGLDYNEQGRNLRDVWKVITPE